MRTNWRSLASLLLVLAMFAAACAGDDGDDAAVTTDVADPTDDAQPTDDAEPTDDAQPTDDVADEGGDLTGSVGLDGSSTVGPLAEVAAELFQEENPGVQVTVAVSGTGGGFQRFCLGETDGNDASREIKEEEAAICEENGISFDFLQLANDALSVIVNPELPVDCLTVEQLSQIWDDGSTVTTWGDVEGLDLDETTAAGTLTPYGPGSDSGTFDYFSEEINGESGQIRNDYIDIGEDDQAAIVAVQGDPFAMAYVPFSFASEAGDSVKQLAIDNGDGCVEATLEAVQGLEYTPLGRGLFVYFSDTALARPEVLGFAQYFIDNAVEIAELAEFIPMTPEQLAEQEAKLAGLVG
ncbi:hypothetical protein BH23ACT9_BH23ACT9_36330 [soil metagenome]